MERLSAYLVVGLACATFAGCDAGPSEVGPRGGTVISEDGRFTLEIPEGALKEPVFVRIEAIDCETERALSACYAVEPSGLGLHRPALVTYELDAPDPDAETASDGESPKLAFAAAREHDWRLLADRRLDLEQATLSASATYLADFAVVDAVDR